MNIQNALLLIGILVLCAVFSHTRLTVGILQNIYSVTDLHISVCRHLSVPPVTIIGQYQLSALVSYL